MTEEADKPNQLTISVAGEDLQVVSTIDYDSPDRAAEALRRLHEVAREVVDVWHALKNEARAGAPEVDASIFDQAIERLSTAAYLAHRHLK